MSMWKDRKRSVKWSNWRSSPPRHILTTARVGPYGIPYTIYIRRYHTRPTTLIPQVSYLIPLLGSQGHQIHRVTGSQGHQGLGSYTSTILGLHGLGSHTSYLIPLVLYLYHITRVTRSPGPPGSKGHQGLWSHVSYLRLPRLPGFKGLIPHISGLIPHISRLPGLPDSHTLYLIPQVSYLRSHTSTVSPFHLFRGLGSYHLPIFKPVKR